MRSGDNVPESHSICEWVRNAVCKRDNRLNDTRFKPRPKEKDHNGIMYQPHQFNLANLYERVKRVKMSFSTYVRRADQAVLVAVE